jgi:uncharacterized membrane protein YjjB (DUF3815 family)
MAVNTHLLLIFHHTVCGALAAAGFGVLFNVGFRGLPWCAASGALALAVRTALLGWDWSLAAASFIAALAVGAAAQSLQSRIGVSRNALAVVGCIPMIPGAVAAKAIMGLFAVTAPHPAAGNEMLITAVQNTLQATFTVFALGTGLAIPTLLRRLRSMK